MAGFRLVSGSGESMLNDLMFLARQLHRPWTADGRRIMVTNFRGSAIRVFSVDPRTAVLTLEGTPYPNHQRAMCWAVLGPDGKTLYASNYVTNNVSVFSIAADSTLALIGSSAPKRLSSVPDSKELQVFPDGKFLYLVGNHQGKGNVLLFPRATDIRRAGPVQCRERLGGLLRYYHQEAA